jgi:hypothetical protein
MPHSAAVPPSRPTRRRAGAVKMQPPTGGTILTAPSTGTSLKSEGRRHHTHIQLKINNHTYTGNLTTSELTPRTVYRPRTRCTSTSTGWIPPRSRPRPRRDRDRNRPAGPGPARPPHPRLPRRRRRRPHQSRPGHPHPNGRRARRPLRHRHRMATTPVSHPHTRLRHRGIGHRRLRVLPRCVAGLRPSPIHRRSTQPPGSSTPVGRPIQQTGLAGRNPRLSAAQLPGDAGRTVPTRPQPAGPAGRPGYRPTASPPASGGHRRRHRCTSRADYGHPITNH